MKKTKYKILYIDDEPHNLTNFKAIFKWDYDISIAKTALEGIDILKREKEIALIISDQRMAGLTGIEFFKKISKQFPNPIRVILTGYSELNVIIQAINECDIYRYITKPWDEPGMKQTIERAIEIYQLRKDKESLVEKLEQANERLAAENNYLKTEIEQKQFTQIITQNKNFQKILDLLERVAVTQTSVLITGETGTGKELMARAIHRFSQRADTPLIKVNCAAIPVNLIESEFFGHERGAFTGATQKRIGRFELANEGTIFLDEIGELPYELQSKLLRILQEGEFERIGGNKTVKVDVRVIAATNKDLKVAIKEGKFREDLFYRLNVFPLNTMPLRERKEDIPLLVHHFLKKHTPNIGRKITKVNESEMAQLIAYNYPGNIRELENLVERFMIISEGTDLELTGWVPIKKNMPFSSNHFLSMEEMEIYHIKNALEKCNGKIFGKGGAAELLKMNGKTLSSRMVKLKIKKK